MGHKAHRLSEKRLFKALSILAEKQNTGMLLPS
jgi:hypothetical protein